MPTTFVIFTMLDDATSYIASVDAQLGWPSGEGGPEYTRTWAEPRKHPTENLWMVVVHPEIAPDTGEIVTGLADDWFPYPFPETV